MEGGIPFNKVLGVEATLLEEGRARLEIPFRQELIGNPMRPALHGGVISALIDACGGCAVFTMIDPPETVTTIDLRVDYLRPGEPKRLICDATVVRMGNRVASVDMRVYQTVEQELIATGKGVYDVRRVKPKAASEG